MSRRIWLPLAAAVLVLWSVTAAIAYTGNIVQATDGSYWNIKSGDRTDQYGNKLTKQTNRPVDDNGLQSMIAMGGLQGITPGGSITSSSYIPMKQFIGGSLQIDWADSLQSAASQDSVAFEVYLIGKRSTTNDGIDYLIDMDPTTSRLDGILVTSPNNPILATTIANARSTVFAPNKLAAIGTAAAFARYSVSVPLYTKVGAPISEEYIGCIVVNRSGSFGGTPSGINIIHGLNVQVEQKVN